VTWWAQRFLPWTTSATTTTLVLLITATWASLLLVTAASASVVDRDAAKAVAILRKDDGLVSLGTCCIHRIVVDHGIVAPQRVAVVGILNCRSGKCRGREKAVASIREEPQQSTTSGHHVDEKQDKRNALSFEQTRWLATADAAAAAAAATATVAKGSMGRHHGAELLASLFGSLNHVKFGLMRQRIVGPAESACFYAIYFPGSRTCLGLEFLN
jgi:hypothetical protein